MATYNNRTYSDSQRGINLRAGNGAIRFEIPTTQPTLTAGERLLHVNAAGALVYDNGLQ